jgi:hypothetical protein
LCGRPVSFAQDPGLQAPAGTHCRFPIGGRKLLVREGEHKGGGPMTFDDKARASSAINNGKGQTRPKNRRQPAKSRHNRKKMGTAGNIAAAQTDSVPNQPCTTRLSAS